MLKKQSTNEENRKAGINPVVPGIDINMNINSNGWVSVMSMSLCFREIDRWQVDR